MDSIATGGQIWNLASDRQIWNIGTGTKRQIKNLAIKRKRPNLFTVR